MTTALTCVASASLMPTRSILLLSGSSGGLSQVQSSYPSGNHILDCHYAIDRIDLSIDLHGLRFGKGGVGAGGHAACPPVASPFTMPEEHGLKGENTPTHPLKVAVSPAPVAGSAPSIMVNVDASVSYNQRTDRYTYSYKLRNL